MARNESRTMTLDEICEGDLQTGPFGSQLHAHDYEDHGIAVVMPRDIVDGCVKISEAAKVSARTAGRLQKHRLKAGDIIFSRRGDVARTALITEETEGSLCGTGCLRARPSAAHNSRYIAYQLQLNHLRVWLEQNAVGQTMPNLNTSILSRLPIHVGNSRAVEDAAVELLNTWDRGIDIVAQLHENTQTQRRALIQDLLNGIRRLPSFEGNTWTQYSFEEIASLGKQRLDPKVDKSTRPCVELEHIESGTGRLLGHSKAEDQDSLKAMFHPSDVLFGKLRPYLRKFYFSDFSGVCSTEIWVLQAERSICEPAYLSYLVQTEAFQKAVNISSGSKMPRADWDVVKETQFRLPGLSEQRAVVGVLACLDRLTLMYLRKRQTLAVEKAALMQQLLTERFRVARNGSATPVAVNG